MLHKKSKDIGRLSLKKAGAFVFCCAVAAAAVMLSVSLSGSDDADKSAKGELSAVQNSERYETAAWRKAGVDEFEVTEAAKEASGKGVIKLGDIKLMVTENTELRADGNVDSQILAMIGSGEFVTAKSRNGNWYEVVYCGQRGYIKGKCLTGYEAESAKSEKAEKRDDDSKAETTVSEQRAETSAKRSVISYTSDEFEMLCCVLEHEVGYCSEESKIAVANVIINRVKSDEFPDTIEEVLNAPKQFTAVWSYYDGSVTPSENTRECAQRALYGEDNSNGALYYYAPKYCYNANTISWFESMTLCLELDGQRYFK